MRFNPIYLKDLKSNVKSMKFAMIIFTYDLCLGLVIILFMYASMHNMNNQIIFNYETCEQLYSVMSGIELGSIFLIVPVFAVGTIAGERENQTLDLLLVSRLKPFHIICGKLAYVFTIIFLLIISGFPLTAMVSVTGSITLKIQWQLLVLLLVTSLYIASIGVFFSTVKKSTVGAALSTYGVVFLITMGTILLYNLNVYVLEDMKMPNGNKFGGLYNLFLFNPLATYVYMFASPVQSGISNWIPYQMQNNWIELSIFSQLAVSVVLLIVSAKKLETNNSSATFQFAYKKRKTL